MNRYAFIAGKAVLPKVAWLLCSRDGNSLVAAEETRNKLFIIETVEFANHFLGGDIKDLRVEEQVARIEANEPYRALWLAEGIGLHYGFRAMKETEAPVGLMAAGCPIPARFMLLSHAGMSMAFVRHYLEGIKASSAKARVGEAVEKIVELLLANSGQGYVGMSFEALGMVTRFFYGQATFESVVAEVTRLQPRFVPQVWHGAGRALYFVHFPPKWREPWPAFALIDRESRDRVSRSNLIAGLASGVMMVNMRSPWVMEAVVRQRVSKMTPVDADAWSNGIICSTIIRREFTPNEKYLMAFPKHQPSPETADVWERVVRQPVEAALNRYYPALNRAGQLDHICCCSPVDEFVEKLERGAATGAN